MTKPLEATVCISTPKATGYLNTLCRHFSHKVAVTHNVRGEQEQAEGRGLIEFSIGQCELKSTANRLDIRCEAPDMDQLTELKEVIKSHFDRFAQKEALVISW